VDTAGRIWEGDSVQLATKEVSLTLIHWMRIGGNKLWRQGWSPAAPPHNPKENWIAYCFS